MDDPRRPYPQRPPEELDAWLARVRRRTEAGLDVPDEWEGFVDAIRELFDSSGLIGAPGGLEAARLWAYLRDVAPADRALTLERALEGGYLLGLDAEAVGRALDLLRHAELIGGTAEGFVTFNPAVPF